MRTIIFEFAGRSPNLKLQLPLMRRILAENPEAEWHIWNLARTRLDGIYLQSIQGERIKVINDMYYGRDYAAVWRWYALRPEYRDDVIVKIDDDIVFMQTDRFPDFVAAVDGNRGAVVSAMVVNNGASTRQEPGLWRRFKALDMPLLDVHKSVEFADVAHQYFFERWTDMLAKPLKVVNTRDWVSINMVGMDWLTLAKIAGKLRTPSPLSIAGRSFTEFDLLGDEGTANLLPRKIVQGFTACHLGFGPQQPAPELLDAWRVKYGAIGVTYLGEKRAA